MARESKKKSKKSAKTTKKKVDKRIPFSIFFRKKIQNGDVNFWQEKEIWVFFEAKGLTKLEEPARYEEILKLY